jgi:membrane associated rhomboid family serine protease
MFPLKDDNPTTITPIVTWALIAINVTVFLYQLSLGSGSSQLFVFQYGAIPSVVLGRQHLSANIAVIPPVLSVFTSMFLHGGFIHLIGNMWFLWIFGNNIEDSMGHLRFIGFYLICGILASWSHIASNPGSMIPSIGASGAISGVMGAYIMLFPRARVLTFIFLFIFIRLLYLPAAVILGYWFLIQLLSGSMTLGEQGGGVAFWAHIGGFVAGVLLVGLFKKKNVRFFSRPHHHRGAYWD